MMNSGDNDLPLGGPDANQVEAQNEADHRLLEQLRRALPPDPVPAAVHQYALASIGLRALGLEIGTLLSDSYDGELASVRSGNSATRTLRLALKDFSVEVQLDGSAIHGRVRPFTAGVGLSIVTTPTRKFVDVDQFGEFRESDVPPGPLRIELQLNGEAAATSEWILRPKL
jgi:hypothetical protein